VVFECSIRCILPCLLTCLSLPEQAYRNADLYALNLFPEDQKFAIYLPFFAPTGLSLLKILKEHFR